MNKNLIDIIKDSPAIVAPFAALGTGTVLYVLNNILYDNTIGLDYCVAASSGVVGAFLPNKSQKIASLVTFATTLSPELTAFCSSQEPTGGEAVIAAKGFLFGMSYVLTKVFSSFLIVQPRK